MKKILFILFVALSLVACEKDFQSQTEKTDLGTIVQNNKVSLKQALLYAENSVNGINPTTRSTERKVKSTEIYVAKPATRSAEDTEVSFYLINYEDNEGFAMVSTDSRTTPVYAYSDSGNLTPEDFETNPFLKIFRDGSVKQYQIEVASYDDRLPIELPDSIYGDITRLPIVEYDGGYYYEEKSSETISKDELLTTYWHQYEPYNLFCSNYVGGCAPVAAAQIMAYHKHPAQHDGHIYNWNAMTATPTLSEGDTGATYAARLVADIGSEAGAYYEPQGNYTEVTTLKKVKNAFIAFDYSCGDPTLYDASIIKENINEGLPVFIRGTNSNNEGHAWVIDGYHYTTYRTTYYYTYEPYARYDTFITSSWTYFHFNLGEGPNYVDQTAHNGYYYATSFEYNDNLKILCDIIPN